MREDSAFTINHALRTKGLASLSEAGALIPQLAMFVRDDAHFRALLNACEPEERGHMYDALAPNVRFKARPLHEYLIENAQDAERRQLPTMGPDGQLKAFKTPEIHNTPGSDAAVVEKLVGQAVEKEHVHVVCLLCTREDVFGGVTKEDAVITLRAAGWRMGFKAYSRAEAIESSTPVPREPIEICPRCVKARAPRMRAA